MLKIAIAQLNFKIGDFEGNTAQIADVLFKSKQEGVDLVVFPEMSVCGYLPDDLLDYPSFVEKSEYSLELVAQSCQGIAAIIGGVMRNPGKGRLLQNVCCFMQKGKIETVIPKTLLPTYDVFSESRYFEPAKSQQIIEFKGYKLGIAICEDLWDLYNNFEYTQSPGEALKALGADLIINPSASPFHLGKDSHRNRVLSGQVNRYNVPVLYVNQVGSHTELLFDGSSRAVNANGEIAVQLPDFESCVTPLLFGPSGFETSKQPVSVDSDPLPKLHKALLFGIRDYFQKMGFQKAILGASGGIDSALVQALAVEALGAENVLAVMMPSRYSSTGSVEDAKKLSENLGNSCIEIPINEIHTAYEHALEPYFKGFEVNIAEENIQARSRAVLLMGLSNKLGYILLNTSNKSEMSVGYSTLYGDLCGSLSIIGDVYKTQVYALARYINRNGTVIPTEIIDKEPSAELRPDQKDSDSLPNYAILDGILRMYIEEFKGTEEIIVEGYDIHTVQRVIQLVNQSEYKRFQAPPIIRVSSKSFGKGRVIPLVAKYPS
jgi:NAD+ synthase (glutamine-hydrolysing)